VAQTPFEIARQYLFDYLKDEFRGFPEVRLRFMLESHEDGVMAKTESREYFFPTDWMQKMDLASIKAEIRRMKEGLPQRPQTFDEP
jgi:hypothetical protein